VPEILEVEVARALLEARALNREIKSVYTPDAWFLKRGTTGESLVHALKGNAFTKARRRGKQIILDTTDPNVKIGVHLGMSGRLLVDDEEAGDPLIYASNERMPEWHRFGVRYKDGGEFMVRDPRRLGAVVLDPDEERLGPDALTLTRKQFDAALGRRTAPIKAVLMDQQRIAGLGNLLVDEILWRAGINPARTVDSLAGDERTAIYKAIRTALRVLARRGGSHTGDMPRVLDAPCPKDGAPIARAKVAGRTTYWCPAHQH
jgi:formamidopyrimidine-DNA glycosylase